MQEEGTPISEGEKEDRHSPVEDGSAETLVQELTKQLQAGLRIIEPIPEEKEEDLEASNAHLTTEQPQIGPVGGEQQQPEVEEESKTLTKDTTTNADHSLATENEAIKIQGGVKEVDTITQVLGEVIANRRQAQASIS